MSDRHKFRVWDDIFGYLRTLTNDNLADCVLGMDGKVYSVNGVGTLEEADGRIIEKCTGQRDPNRTLIYEGDIFLNGESVRIIEFHGGNFLAVTPCGSQAILLSFIIAKSGNVVIGNIHENPELLEVAK